ncbi:MAG: hypothetical protein ACTHMZ_15350 [Actinomycetes bacterium]
METGEPQRHAARGGVWSGWTSLIAELESEFDTLVAAEAAAEHADVVRTALARARLLERIAALHTSGGSCRVLTADGAGRIGTVAEVGPDWLLLASAEGGPRSTLVPLSAVAALVVDAGQLRQPGDGEVWRRFGLQRILARLTRDRAVVALSSAGSRWRGRLEAVGEDHALLAPVEPGEVRPHGRDLVAISLDHLMAVEMDAPLG